MLGPEEKAGEDKHLRDLVDMVFPLIWIDRDNKFSLWHKIYEVLVKNQIPTSRRWMQRWVLKCKKESNKEQICENHQYVDNKWRDKSELGQSRRVYRFER